MLLYSFWVLGYCYSFQAHISDFPSMVKEFTDWTCISQFFIYLLKLKVPFTEPQIDQSGINQLLLLTAPYCMVPSIQSSFSFCLVKESACLADATPLSRGLDFRLHDCPRRASRGERNMIDPSWEGKWAIHGPGGSHHPLHVHRHTHTHPICWSFVT